MVYISITFGPRFMYVQCLKLEPGATQFTFEDTNDFLGRFNSSSGGSIREILYTIAQNFDVLIACLFPELTWYVCHYTFHCSSNLISSFTIRTSEKWLRYKALLIQASAHLPVWPDVREQLHENLKIQFQKDLCTLANHFQLVMPVTYFSDALPSHATGYVRKENLSENASGLSTWKRRTKEKEAKWGLDSDFFVQERISTLKTAGEYRVTDLCDLSRSRVALTIPNHDNRNGSGVTWTWSILHNTRVLSALENLPDDSWHLDNNPRQTAEETLALDNVRTFSSTMLSRIHAIESARFDFPLSIAHFARVDVGVMRGKDHQAHYFVNEVARAPISCLWYTHDDNGFHSSSIGVKVWDAIHEYYGFWVESPLERPYFVG